MWYSDTFWQSGCNQSTELIHSFIHSRMVLECQRKLNDIGKNNKVFFVWVPGQLGNKEANTLARKEPQTPFISPEPFCGIGKSTRTSFRCRKKPKEKHSARIFLGQIFPKSFFYTAISNKSGSQQEYTALPHWIPYRALSPLETPHENGISRKWQVERRKKLRITLVKECLAITNQRKSI